MIVTKIWRGHCVVPASKFRVDNDS